MPYDVAFSELVLHELGIKVCGHAHIAASIYEDRIRSRINFARQTQLYMFAVTGYNLHFLHLIPRCNDCRVH